ncbi:MAG: hypothetical protein R3Y46_00620 [Opitutales bacterium]
MKKFSLFILSLFVLTSPLASFAKDMEDRIEDKQESLEAIESSAETKKRLQANVEKKDNEDVLIKIDAATSARPSRGETMPTLLKSLLSYSVLNFRDLASSREGGNMPNRAGGVGSNAGDNNKMMPSSSSKRERPSGREGGRDSGREGGRESGASEGATKEAPAMTIDIKEIIKTANLSLAKKRMSLKMLSFSSGTIQLLITNGTPLFAMLKWDRKAFEAISERSSSRPSDRTEMNNWKGSLRDKTQKKIEATKETFPALVIGYNKETKEYLVQSENYGSVWLVESELKSAISSAYFVKY